MNAEEYSENLWALLMGYSPEKSHCREPPREVSLDHVVCIDTLQLIPDLEAAVSLIGKQLTAGGETPDRARLLASLRMALSGGGARLFLWTTAEGAAGGFAFGNVGAGLESGGRYLWLNELYVDEPYRRSGAGSELLRYIESWSRAQGIRTIACVTGKTNNAAHRLYAHNGFSVNEIMWVEKSLG